MSEPFDKSQTALPAGGDPPVLAEFCGYLLQKDRSQNTIYQYRQDLLTFFRYLVVTRGNLPPSEDNLHAANLSDIDKNFICSISQEEIYAFLTYLVQVRHNASSARQRKLSSLRAFFKFCVRVKGWMDASPTENIESPATRRKLPRFLSEEESAQLLQAVDEDAGSPTRARDYAIFTLFLNCGLRLSELTGINLVDLDRDLSRVMVLGKGAKERVIYLNEACRAALREYLAVREAPFSQKSDIKDKNALFLSRLGRRISKVRVQQIVYKYLSEAGLQYKHLSVHKLRHTAATLLYRTGKVDVRVLKDILGHEQLNTTQIYTHVSDAQMQRAMEENPLAGMRSSPKKSAARSVDSSSALDPPPEGEKQNSVIPGESLPEEELPPSHSGDDGGRAK